MAKFRAYLELLNKRSKLRVIHRREIAQGGARGTALNLSDIFYLNGQPWFRLGTPAGAG